MYPSCSEVGVSEDAPSTPCRNSCDSWTQRYCALKRTLAVCSGTTSHLHDKKLKRNVLCEVGESSGASLVM